MIKGLIKKVFGSANDRIIKSLKHEVLRINALETEMKTLSDDELRSKSSDLKLRVTNGESLDKVLPEAFALVREASVRTLKMRHFDVQLIGGIIMHRGMISEMKTGEGKTLVATLPSYLNALSGKGVHVVTVNEYLVERDAEWVGKIHRFLGLEVSCITSKMTPEQKREAYNADITYGTNNEFGFDYLRDNLKFSTKELVQRPFNFAIVDEVDSILIDESRTPLIISGPAEDYSQGYMQVDNLIPLLSNDDFEVDEKNKSVSLTESGNTNVEKLLQKHNVITANSGLFDMDNMNILHHVNLSLRAHNVFEKDVDYIVKEGKVMIIDEFTGRIMEGRRFSEGLHQALEAKEKVKIMRENQTVASITFQNYFRMYPKLAGMTGTAVTEANEFMDIYKLEVVSIPTHIPITRIDEQDIIYRTMSEKSDAILEDIRQAHEKKQPVLIGTISIEKSEALSNMLKKAKIKHKVLNARFHDKEAEIIAKAGALGAVTVATNMAGRGTDIRLGGNADAISPDDKNYEAKLTQIEADAKKVKELGGLLVIGTERHESRRIDNQLRGRSGRQGDPGRTVFYISLEDDLMRLFGSEKISGMLKRLGLKDGESITHSFISRSIAKAQQKVEARNYDARKNLLKYDDVMNQQRKIIYAERLSIMESDDVLTRIISIIEEVADDLDSKFMPPKTYKEQWDMKAFSNALEKAFGFKIDVESIYKQEGKNDADIIDYVIEECKARLDNRASKYQDNLYRDVMKHVMLMTLDQVWKEHLHTLDHLRQGIYLRAYAQKDPLNEYKFESFALFKEMLNEYSNLIVNRVLNMNIDTQGIEEAIEGNHEDKNLQMTRTDPAIAANSNEDAPGAMPASITTVKNPKNVKDRDPNDPKTWGKVLRNEACPCGSGRKYKHCHGSI